MNHALSHANHLIEPARLPWFFFAFLLIIFALASFYPLESVDYVSRKDKSVETRLDESIQRTETGDITRRIALCALGGMGVILLLRQSPNRLQLQGIVGILLILFLAWATASIFWSRDVPLTIRRIVILWFLCLGALAMAKHFSFREIIYFVFISGCVTIVGGVICEILLGTFKPWDMEYRFAGFMNPIFQGAHSGMTIITALVLAHQSTQHRRWYLIAAIIAFAAMLLTHSRGPTGATVAAVIAYGWLMRPGFRKVVVFGAIFAVILLAFPSMRKPLLGSAEHAMLSGRPVEIGYEMQGRDALWKECLKFSAKSPALGYGYDAFWTRDFTYAVTDASGFTSQHTHNAFLDLLLGIGLPGALIYSLIIVLSMIVLAVRYRNTRSPFYAGALALIVLYAIHNIFVSVQLAAQLQTFAVMMFLFKLGFVHDAEQSEMKTGNA